MTINEIFKCHMISCSRDKPAWLDSFEGIPTQAWHAAHARRWLHASKDMYTNCYDLRAMQQQEHAIEMALDMIESSRSAA